MPRVICKLYIEKVHDHVNWDCVLFLLKRFGFGEKWKKWIQYCMSTVQVLTYGQWHSTGFFGSQGLRQGNPLSLLLSPK